MKEIWHISVENHYRKKTLNKISSFPGVGNHRRFAEIWGFGLLRDLYKSVIERRRVCPRQAHTTFAKVFMRSTEKI